MFAKSVLDLMVKLAGYGLYRHLKNRKDEKSE